MIIAGDGWVDDLTTVSRFLTESKLLGSIKPTEELERVSKLLDVTVVKKKMY